MESQKIQKVEGQKFQNSQKKKKNKRGRKGDKKNRSKGKDPNRREAYVDFQYKNIYFEMFYKHCLAPDFKTPEEFTHFLERIKDHLPVSFRINGSYPNIQKIISIMDGSPFIKQCFDTAAEGLSEEDYEFFKKKYGTDLKKVNLKKLGWYPQKLVYFLNLSRRGLRKSKGLKKFHKLVQAASECGILVRQEVVSMLPPLFLKLQPDDLVLDMCAAPGSKTSQIMELLNMAAKAAQTTSGDAEAAGDNILAGTPTGGVIANDMEEKRAYMLAHRVRKINSPAIAVINHEGQFIPTVYNRDNTGIDEETGVGQKKEKVYFDKIMVDAPCSGDGAIRKLPNRWRSWTTKDGFALHKVQIALVKRALQLVKVGGRVVYSTCSLNPIENEAVVTEILHLASKTNPGSLELEDCHAQLEGLIGRRGLHHWDVLMEWRKGPHPFKANLEDHTLDDLFYVVEGAGRGEGFKSEFRNAEQLTDAEKEYVSGYLRESMFPLKAEEMQAFGVERTMRLMPHDQNTGGFFVAVFLKKGEIRFEEVVNEDGGGNGEEAEAEEAGEGEKAQTGDGGDEKADVVQEGDEEAGEKAGMAVEGEGNEKAKGGVEKEYLKLAEINPEECERILSYYGLEGSQVGISPTI